MNVASLATTLPMLLVGMLGIFLVIGVIILVVTLLNKIFSSKGE
ncbi:MAG: OadG-related small transporter subunit [Gemmiger sp.]|uniref:Oxaloacetate decarboxylase n=1 Tax=Subdoligranulum variabile TaxID=214851 RepID=A0A921IKQ8_9FIRM|nr:MULTISPECIES: OadG-related small transporter subunit [Gemmiger]MBM6898765.1 oxaloacetate decarboxylase [Gemmiger formicilis]MEE0710354.1 OadG-related small transporter subunit [Gemmiger sp.]HJG28386.1 oxaloacetate decarboxylase [Subdoligranulum variabile]